MFDNYLNYRTSEAMWLYTILLFVVPFIGHIAQSFLRKDYKVFFFFYAIAFLVLWFFLAFSIAGEDYDSYARMFMTYDSLSSCEVSDLEYGFQLINVFVHIFTDNPVFGVAFIKSIHLLLTFLLIHELRNRASISMMLMSYIAVIYLNSFNIIRMCVAWSIVGLGYLNINRKPFVALMFAFIGVFVHRSSLFFLLFVIYYLLIKIANTKVPIIKLVVVSISFLGLLIYSAFIYGEELIMIGFSEGRYDHYLEDVSSGDNMGLGVFFVFLPQFFLLFWSRKLFSKTECDKNWWSLCLFSTIIGVAIYLLGYQLYIISRANCYFFYPFMIYMGMYAYRKVGRKKYIVMSLYCYWYLRFLIETRLLFLDAGVEKLLFI